MAVMYAPAKLDELDERDGAIVAEALELLGNRLGPRVGDFVRFADGVERRISYVWDGDPADLEAYPGWVQTSDGGHYFLGSGYVSMSGSLYPGVLERTLSPTGETREGWVWFFHHGQARAHNGVDVLVPGFRVYGSSVDAPR